MKTILIVDDEPDIIKTVKLALRNRGYNIVSASAGGEALGKIDHYDPDLVILDLKLPDLAGEEVCRQIRKGIRRPEVPIIMLTAKNLDVDIVIGKVIGADYYMTKPFDLNELVKKVCELAPGEAS